MAVEETTLLDSSLKSKYESLLKPLNNRVFYTCKIIHCGDYVQLYYFDNLKSKIDKDNFIDSKEEKKHKVNKIIKSIDEIDTENLYKKENKDNLKSILLSNAFRSNFNCQRICKANADIWESFITLTFKENLKDISIANKKFNYFVSNVRKKKKDFKYIAVPEFQKRGAVHYHLLSNLSKEDTDIIIKQKNTEESDNFYDVKYWNKGFSAVDFIKSDYKKIFSYISKYMTKDIDNRLFGKKRYFFSLNLNQPKTDYLNLDNPKDFDYFLDLTSGSNIEYQSEYIDNYTKNTIKFMEIKKN